VSVGAVVSVGVGVSVAVSVGVGVAVSVSACQERKAVLGTRVTAGVDVANTTVGVAVATF
jgi:hypothetical protein